MLAPPDKLRISYSTVHLESLSILLIDATVGWTVACSLRIPHHMCLHMTLLALNYYHQPTNAFIAVTGGEMEGCPSLVICCAGVNVILQELSNWRKTPFTLAKMKACKHPLTPGVMHRHTCVNVVSVGCFPKFFHSCGDKPFKMTCLQILLWDWMNEMLYTFKVVLDWRVTDVTVHTICANFPATIKSVVFIIYS